VGSEELGVAVPPYGSEELFVKLAIFANPREIEQMGVMNVELPNFERGWAVLDRWRVGTLTNINERLDRHHHVQSCDNLAGN
jgi:hypothetical protein